MNKLGMGPYLLRQNIKEMPHVHSIDSHPRKEIFRTRSIKTGYYWVDLKFLDSNFTFDGLKEFILIAKEDGTIVGLQFFIDDSQNKMIGFLSQLYGTDSLYGNIPDDDDNIIKSYYLWTADNNSTAIFRKRHYLNLVVNYPVSNLVISLDSEEDFLYYRRMSIKESFEEF